jgi:catechol 2,3-dioxygenase-like lactoylglutathione lyase family enzyme
MSYKFNHVHLKAPDPEKSANWFVNAFNFKILSDTVRASGDRFVRCETSDGIVVNISGARTDEEMGTGNASAHWGLEHFGVEVDDLDTELKRLGDLGARLLEGPIDSPTGLRIGFIQSPDDVRIELLQLPKRDA